jgi:hypothetical protein
MKNLNFLNKNRIPHPITGDMGDSTCGMFLIRFIKKGDILAAMASDAEGWDHVSVSLQHRCPTWEEMSFIKRLFFEDYECAVQYHPPVKDNVSLHPYCLHMWRFQGSGGFPMPPKEMIA